MTGSSLVRKMKGRGCRKREGKKAGTVQMGRVGGGGGGDSKKEKIKRKRQIGLQLFRFPAEALVTQRPDGSLNSLMTCSDLNTS